VIGRIASLAAVFALCSSAGASLVGDVRAAIGRGDLAAAERLVATHRQAAGETPEVAAAVSWLGRGAVQAQEYDRAERHAIEARRLALKLLAGRSLDDDRELPTALGASIEVQAQAMAARSELSEAIAFLSEEAERWKTTSIRERIHKNINLLSLEGKPAPRLVWTEHLGPRPEPLEALRGKVLLLFFWAHWCGDCKGQAPSLARLSEEFGAQGFTVVGPTKRYGFAARGVDANPEEEVRHIEGVRQKFYAGIPGMAIPVSEENFVQYGCSTTPTIVLVDREGIVRLYHPGEMPYEELASKVRELL
jgi:thiol-disulfide isomerase/thioredoxin